MKKFIITEEEKNRILGKRITFLRTIRRIGWEKNILELDLRHTVMTEFLEAGIFRIIPFI